MRGAPQHRETYQGDISDAKFVSEIKAHNAENGDPSGHEKLQMNWGVNH